MDDEEEEEEEEVSEEGGVNNRFTDTDDACVSFLDNDSMRVVDAVKAGDVNMLLPSPTRFDGDDKGESVGLELMASDESEMAVGDFDLDPLVVVGEDCKLAVEEADEEMGGLKKEDVG